MQNENDDMIEIDLMEVLGLLWHRLWLIALCMLAGGAAAFGISKFVLTEQFQSTTRVYVLNKQNENTLTYSDVQLGTQLTKDFREIIKSRYVLERVAETCGLGKGPGGLASRISVDTQSDTRIITITVTDEDPAMAQYLADEVRKEAAERIKSVMDIEAVNVVDEANLPTSPSSPKVSRWTLVGAALGAVLCAVVILILYMLDDTVKTSEDVEKYLGLSTLGMIPIREDEAKQKHGKKKRKTGRGKNSGRSGQEDRSTVQRGGRGWEEEEEDRVQPAEENAAGGQEARVTEKGERTAGKTVHRSQESGEIVRRAEIDRETDIGTGVGSRADRIGSRREAADTGDKAADSRKPAGGTVRDRKIAENRTVAKKEPVEKAAIPEKKGISEGRGQTDRKTAAENQPKVADTVLRGKETGYGEKGWRESAARED